MKLPSFTQSQHDGKFQHKGQDILDLQTTLKMPPKEHHLYGYCDDDKLSELKFTTNHLHQSHTLWLCYQLSSFYVPIAIISFSLNPIFSDNRFLFSQVILKLVIDIKVH